MAKDLVERNTMKAIGNAIRSKLNASTRYKPSEMPGAIGSIPEGYPEPAGTVNITQNGTQNVKDYASANVNVPNSYAAGDEGKVVSNGALVAQTARAAAITQNGTYDTTLNNSVVVNVSGGGGSQDEVHFYKVAYLGDQDMAAVTSLAYTISGYSGFTAILVVAHRDSITVPSGWTHIHDSVMSGVTQTVSVYTKVIGSDTETGTITQASSARIAGTIWCVKESVTVAHKEDVSGGGEIGTPYSYLTYTAKETLLAIYDEYGQHTNNAFGHPYAEPNANILMPNTLKNQLRHYTCVINGYPENEVATRIGELMADAYRNPVEIGVSLPVYVALYTVTRNRV